MRERDNYIDWSKYAARTMELEPADRERCKWFTSRIPEKATLMLDLGCGTGRHSEAIGKDNPSLKIHAWDPDPHMFSIVSKKEHIAEVAQKGALDLNAKEKYDVIWANMSLFYLEEKSLPEAFQRIQDALKPEGILGVTFVKRPEENSGHVSKEFQKKCQNESWVNQGELYSLIRDSRLSVEYMSETIGGFAGTPCPIFRAIAKK